MMFCTQPATHHRPGERGFTLIETVIFLVALSIALTGVAKVFHDRAGASVDPVLRLYALEEAQSLLDEVLARKFDQNTPTGGVPACNSFGGPACAGITPDGAFDDVGDYHGYSKPYPTGFALNVAVVEAGDELSLPAAEARRVSVTIALPNDHTFILSAYKVNF